MSNVLLSNGSRGSAVRQVQQALIELEWDLDVDGAFGDATETAVREFQAANGLTIDGIVGPDTLAALGIDTDETATRVAPRAPLLSNGSRGKAVRQVQQALVDHGWDLDVDGAFGDATEAAVLEFQGQNDLSADGIVGPDTLAALGID